MSGAFLVLLLHYHAIASWQQGCRDMTCAQRAYKVLPLDGDRQLEPFFLATFADYAVEMEPGSAWNRERHSAIYGDLIARGAVVEHNCAANDLPCAVGWAVSEFSEEWRSDPRIENYFNSSYATLTREGLCSS